MSGAGGKQATDSSYYMNKKEKRVRNYELQELLRARVIAPSKHKEGEFISGLFTRQKSDGTYRMILNLKEFNKNVEHKKFKMETLKSVLNLVTKN